MRNPPTPAVVWVFSSVHSDKCRDAQKEERGKEKEKEKIPKHDGVS
jgi:hypothetical protein